MGAVGRGLFGAGHLISVCSGAQVYVERHVHAYSPVGGSSTNVSEKHESTPTFPPVIFTNVLRQKL